MNRRDRILGISKCLDRLERIYTDTENTDSLKILKSDRLAHFIDLDVSKVNVKGLLESEDPDFIHDVEGIFNNIERDVMNPNKSSLRFFVPRVGFDKE